VHSIICSCFTFTVKLAFQVYGFNRFDKYNVYRLSCHIKFFREVNYNMYGTIQLCLAIRAQILMD
jgi:hypothetical protein